MADYYTQTVLTEPVYLTEELYGVLTLLQADITPAGDTETVLDGIVRERPPLTKYYVTFPEGWRTACGEDVDEFLVEHLDLGEEEIEALSDKFREMIVMDEPELLREIIKLNPEMEHIEMQSSWSCSKMRLDGFGGSGLIVNRKGYLYLTTTHYEIDEDGVIEHAGGFKFWEPEAEQPEPEQAAKKHPDTVFVDELCSLLNSIDDDAWNDDYEHLAEGLMTIRHYDKATRKFVRSDSKPVTQ